MGMHKPLWDKDYLKIKCPTPDCNAPVYKVSLFKDDLEHPLELTDDELTRKILAGGMKYFLLKKWKNCTHI